MVAGLDAPAGSGADPDPPEIAALLEAFSGGLVFDVGGNIGTVAQMFASRFDRVESFEPAFESYGSLLAAADKVPEITAHDVAVSDIDGVVALFITRGWIEQGQLTSFVDSADVRLVNCRSLDSLSTELGVPDLVKIDVEGHETRVVLGGLDLLARHTPALFIEVHNAVLGQQLIRMLDPIYGDRLVTHRHPNYPRVSTNYRNHYFLVTRL